jgi:hypothetical protein
VRLRSERLVLAATVLSTCAVLGQTPARAAETDDQPSYSERSPRDVDRLKVMWRVELGYRGAFVTDAGYNPFSTQDYFAQASLAASRTIFTRGRFSFAPGLAWDYGRSGATSRGASTSLDVHRFVVPLEGRVHFGSWGYAFVRAAPGIALESAEVDDPSAPGPLTGPPAPAPLAKSRWLFATDLSAGYAFPLFPRTDPYERVPRAWLQADGGYGWIVTQRLNLAPDLPSGDPRLASGIDLGSLTMRGAFVRVAAAASF